MHNQKPSNFQCFMIFFNHLMSVCEISGQKVTLGGSGFDTAANRWKRVGRQLKIIALMNFNKVPDLCPFLSSTLPPSDLAMSS